MTLTEQGHAIVEWDTHIGKWVQESGRLDHDAGIGDLIVPLLQSHFYVVDGGANIGTHTIRYAAAVPAGNVYAFEPNPEAFICLKHNLRNYGNTECLHYGLSNTVESPTLLQDQNVGGSHLVRREGMCDGKALCITLDSMQLPRCDFIKLDVEGWELFALQGATETIQKHRPTMLIEMNMGTLARNGVTYQDIFEFLSQMGYEWKPFAQDVDLNHEPQYDLLATPRGPQIAPLGVE